MSGSPFKREPTSVACDRELLTTHHRFLNCLNPSETRTIRPTITKIFIEPVYNVLIAFLPYIQPPRESIYQRNKLKEHD